MTRVRDNLQRISDNKNFGNMDKVKKQSDSIISSNVEWLLKSGLQGIIWAAEQLNDRGGLPRDNSGASVEQSDAMCQLLRLLMLCYSDLVKFIDESSLTEMIQKLHGRILEFCIISGNDDRGGVKYQLGLDTECSWCTMFCMQALRLWQKRIIGQLKNNEKRMDFFV